MSGERETKLQQVARTLRDVSAALGDTAANGTIANARNRLAEALETVTDADKELRQEALALAAAVSVERERYRDLFDRAPDAYLVTDVVGKIVEANRASEELFGVEARFLVGKPLASYVALADRREFRQVLLRLARHERLPELELSLEPRRGMVVDAAITAGHIYGDGSVTGLRWIIRDVTERRRAAAEIHALALELEERVRERTAELETERALLETVIQQMPAGVLIAARDGDLVLGNPQISRIFRHEIGEVAERVRFQGRGFHSDGRPLADDEWPLARSLARGDVVIGQLIEILRGDDTRGIAEVTSAPILDTRGEITGAVAIFHDVTERELRERAERDFVTNAAHELQTPLTSITSAIEVLQGGAKEDAADRDRFLGHIQRESDRLTRLARALLVLARAQTGTEPPTREPLDLSALLAQVVADTPVRPEVAVELECAPELRVLADRDLAEQMLANVLGNAAKYTSEGTIRVTARPSRRGNRAVIEVADSGPGIAADARDRVFERFYRAEGRTRDGFGLGLAIVEQAARALSGDVEIATAAGGGTVVRVTLPTVRR